MFLLVLLSVYKHMNLPPGLNCCALLHNRSLLSITIDISMCFTWMWMHTTGFVLPMKSCLWWLREVLRSNPTLTTPIYHPLSAASKNRDVCVEHVLKPLSDSLSEQVSPLESIYQCRSAVAQECFHFQHPLDKVCEMFRTVCDGPMKECIIEREKGMKEKVVCSLRVQRKKPKTEVGKKRTFCKGNLTPLNCHF